MTQAQQSTAKGWMPDDSTFGARLALVRQRMGWGNVREAAVECGVPPESWRTWERDGVVPRRIVEIAGLIAERTGCDYGWLLAGPRLRGENIGFTGRYPAMTVRTTDGSRPRDSRPKGRALAAAGAGPGRTAYLERRGRD